MGIPELLPLVGGSGGSGGDLNGTVAGGNGGGGGGALLIASSTVIDLGSGSSTPAILTNGGNGATVSGARPGGGGSGGAIRLIATDIRGSRGLAATGGAAQFSGSSGRIRLESVRLLAYTGQTTPPASINKPGQIGPVRPPVTPTLRIVSIAGIPLPAQPTFDSSTPDLLLPADFTTPVAIELEATNVPAGTRATVYAAPQAGAASLTSQVVTLGGPMGQPKRGTASLTLPRRGVGNIHVVLESAVFPETSGSADEKQ